MFSRTVRSSLIGKQWPIAAIRNTYHRAMVTTESHASQTPISTITASDFTRSTDSTTSSQPKPPFYPRPQGPISPPPRTEPVIEENLDASVDTLLPLLRSQPPFYSTILIHGKPYLVTEGDSIRLPFLMQGVEPGDVLRFNRVTAIGSRDYTLKAGTKETRNEKQKCLDERLYVIRARVMGTVQEPERLKIWHVKRRRHKKHIWSQHKFTVLKITQLSVSDSVNSSQE
jgi:large subunit ribosomal protein L21